MNIMVKGKGKYNKGNTGPTTTTTISKEEKASSTINRLDKEIRSKDNKDMAKEKDTATSEKARDTTTTNKEEKEQKENTQQMFATDAGSQDTWLINAECRSTTATLAISTPTTKQMIGTIRRNSSGFTLAFDTTTQVAWYCTAATSMFQHFRRMYTTLS